MLEITLLDENQKEFTVKQKGIKTRAMRELIKFYTKMEKHEKAVAEGTEKGRMEELQIVDEMIMLVADMFMDPRVNFDTILDSIDFNDLMPTIEGIFEKAMGGDEESK